MKLGPRSTRSILALAMVLSFQFCATAADEAKAQPAKEVVQLKLTPAKGPLAVPASVDLIGQGDRTRVEVTLLRLPGGLQNPQIVATIYKGACSDANKSPVHSFNSAASNPNVNAKTASMGMNFEGMAPVALATLRSGSYSVGVMSGPADGNAQLACGDIK